MSREVMQQALEALEWFVENDDTVIGMKGNEFWEAGLNRGIDTVAVLRKELDHIPDAGKMVGPEPVLFIHPSTLEMASAHVGAWKPGHELPGYIALYTARPQRQPLTDEVHNAFLQGIRYAANKYEVVSDEMFTGGDVSNFLLMEAEELDSSDITRAIETSNGIKEQA